MASSIVADAPAKPGTVPFTAFSSVTRSTDLTKLNLDWRERDLPEKIRTKHVHRLHPYLGKFIPQIVEIFLRKYSPKRIMDPFAGSGTSLVEASVLGVDSVGYDVSEFNCLMMRVKTAKYDIPALEREVRIAVDRTKRRLNPSLFFDDEPFVTDSDNDYLNAWYHPTALRELLCFREQIQNLRYRDFFDLVLSRAGRSARRTTHFELDFPRRPTTKPYECHKHSRICKPTETAWQFIERYAWDSFERVSEYSRLRKDCRVDVRRRDVRTGRLPKVSLAITSPPYVGLIDYHEQHRYSYELLGLKDNRSSEIGAAAAGNSTRAVADYREDMVRAMTNARRVLPKGGRCVVIAADKRNLYPKIASEAGFEEEMRLSRDVNRRTGRRSTRFSENVFIWRK